MRWFFLLLPWIELFTLLQLGARIGAGNALLYVLLTLVTGLGILKWQGRELLERMREAERGWVVPRQWMADELALGMAGLLLMIPGLVTDSLALVVVIGPLLRRAFVRQSDNGRSEATTPGRRDGPQTIDGEFRRIDE